MLLDTIESGISRQNMTTILHLKPDLAVLNVEDKMRSRVLTGSVQGANHFPASFAMNRIYEFYLSSGVTLMAIFSQST